MEEDNIESLDDELDNGEVLEENEQNNEERDVTSIQSPPSNEKQLNKESSENKYESYQKRLLKYGITCLALILFLVITIIVYKKITNNTSYYTENSGANYQVCLTKNDYYKEKCLQEGLEYITAITDKIAVDFNYNAVYQKKQSKKYKYYINSKIVVKTDDENEKELLSKEKKLFKSKAEEMNGNVINISESVEIPFKEYNSYAQNYKNEYSLLNNSDLVVSLILKEGKTEKTVSSIVIPLTKLTYSINKQNITNQTSEYTVKTSIFVKIIFLLVIIIICILLLLSLKELIEFLFKTRNKQTEYQKKLKHILNTYDRVIVTLTDKNTIVNNQEIYTVESFLELLDVRDTIDKPILYYKVNDIKTEFYVQDADKTYKFTMKESDF